MRPAQEKKLAAEFTSDHVYGAVSASLEACVVVEHDRLARGVGVGSDLPGRARIAAVEGVTHDFGLVIERSVGGNSVETRARSTVVRARRNGKRETTQRVDAGGAAALW